MELRKLEEGIYDTAKLSRLSKSDDFAELDRIIKDICTELDSVRNVDKESAQSDVLGRIYAYEAMQQLLDIVHGTEPIDTRKLGNNKYT